MPSIDYRAVRAAVRTQHVLDLLGRQTTRTTAVTGPPPSTMISNPA
jgi:hypothetical protein